MTRARKSLGAFFGVLLMLASAPAWAAQAKRPLRIAGFNLEWLTDGRDTITTP